jgi:hypothetical protein
MLLRPGSIGKIGSASTRSESPAPSPAPTDRVVTYGTSTPLLVASAGTTRQKCTRKVVVIGADTPYIYGTFDNCRTEASGDQFNLGNLTILQHGYLSVDGAVSKVATFDNGASTTKTLGTTDATGIRIPHDKITAAEFYGPPVQNFTRGTRLMMQTDVVAEEGAMFLFNAHCQPAGDSSAEFAVTGSPLPLSTGSAGTVNEGYTASCVYGFHADRAHINCGDSIAADSGDSTSNSIRGGYSRYATNIYGDNPVPMLNIARHGCTAAQIAPNAQGILPADGVMRNAYLVPGTFTDISENFAANDLGSSPSVGAAEVVFATKQRLWTHFRERGAEWITVIQPTPRTVNASNNTPINAGWAKGGESDHLRALQEGALDNGLIEAIIRSDTLRGSSNPEDDGYFIYSDLRYSLDGTHLNPRGYLIVHAEHRAVILHGDVSGDIPDFPEGQVILDTFSGPAGASVKGRLTDSGSTWQGLTAGANMIMTDQGRAYVSANGYMFVLDPRMSRQQYIEVDVDTVTATAVAQTLLLRADTTGSAFTGLTASFNPSTLAASLFSVSNGTSTQIGSSVTVPDPGPNVTVRAELVDCLLSLFVGPKGGPLTLALTGMVSNIEGAIGVRQAANSTATTGRQLAEVRAGNMPATMP